MLIPVASTIKEIYYRGTAQRAAGVALTALFLMVSWFSFAAATAELRYLKNTPEDALAAVRMAPENAAFQALLAEHLEAQSQDPTPYLIEATKLSPLDAKYLIRRAFRTEIDGDFVLTEKLLLDAARIDHKSAPRWALMNFYFRRGRDADFWTWFTKTLSISQDDVSAIFRLGWSLTQDSEAILGHIPNTPSLMSRYFTYLLDNQQLDDASTVAVRVATSGPENLVPALLAYCDRYAEGDTGRALPVWNALSRAGKIPFQPLDPASGKFLTNTDFAVDATRHGFDWSSPAVDGVSSGRTADSKGIRLEFNGNQPEECDLLAQRIPLTPGRTYQISWRAESEPSDPVRGLAWEIREGSEGRVEATGEINAGDEPGIFAFEARTKSAVLALRYKRKLGAKRASGAISLREIEGRLVQ